MPLPRKYPLESELHLSVAPHQVTQLRVGILRHGRDQARNFDGVAFRQSFYAVAHAQAALDVWRSLLRGVCAHDRSARPDIGLKSSGLDQHHLDAKRVDLEAKRFAPAFESVFGRGI